MARLPQILRPRKGLKGRAIVVDLANIRVPVEERDKVLVGSKPQDPFLFADILDIERDIRDLNPGVPVFYLLDHMVSPHEMTEEENDEFVNRRGSEIFSASHIWRVGKDYQKADHAICHLVNQLGVLVVSSDRFKDHIRNGTIERPNELLRMSAKRASRDVAHRFRNEVRGGRWSTMSDLLQVPASVEEYWLWWREHAEEIIPWLDQMSAEFARAQLATFEERVRDLRAEAATTVVPTGGEASAPFVSMPSRPSRLPVVLCGDYWGLGHHVGEWVRVVGRLFQDPDGMTLRDLASSAGVQMPGIQKPKSITTGSWVAGDGILRRDTTGFFLESGEWAVPGDPAELPAAFPAYRDRSRRVFPSWGRPPWAPSLSDRPVEPSTNPSIVEVAEAPSTALEPDVLDPVEIEVGTPDNLSPETGSTGFPTGVPGPGTPAHPVGPSGPSDTIDDPPKTPGQKWTPGEQPDDRHPVDTPQDVTQTESAVGVPSPTLGTHRVRITTPTIITVSVALAAAVALAVAVL